MLLLRFILSVDRLDPETLQDFINPCGRNGESHSRNETTPEGFKTFTFAVILSRDWDGSGTGLFPAECPSHPPDPAGRAPSAESRAALTGRYLTGSHPTAASRSLSPPSALTIEPQPSTPFSPVSLCLFFSFQKTLTLSTLLLASRRVSVTFKTQLGAGRGFGHIFRCCLTQSFRNVIRKLSSEPSCR